MLSIREVSTGKQLEQARNLFVEYADSLDFELCFQDFDTELETLPGEYARPWGLILLADYENSPCGCVALRKLEQDVCEMKRLYVQPRCRGLQIGKKLAGQIIKEAGLIGYKRMRLDTVSSMVGAIALYKSLGFIEIHPYCHNPLDDAMYFELAL